MLDGVELFLAIENDSSESISNIVCAGYDLHILNDVGRTPIQEAVLTEKPQALSGLLKAGFGVNEKDSDGQTALHYAAWAGNKLIAEMLLRAGADVLIEDRDGATPLRVALRHSNWGVVAAFEACYSTLLRSPKIRL